MPDYLFADASPFDALAERIHRDNLFLAWGLAATWTEAEIERLFALTTELIRRDAGMTEPGRDRA
jgi:hypothetical protein